MHVCITSHSEAIKPHYKLAKSKMATHNRAANMPCILSRAFFFVFTRRKHTLLTQSSRVRESVSVCVRVRGRDRKQCSCESFSAMRKCSWQLINLANCGDVIAERHLRLTNHNGNA